MRESGEEGKRNGERKGREKEGRERPPSQIPGFAREIAPDYRSRELQWAVYGGLRRLRD